ncbi:MAG: CehA/McbA family metallohydrolase [Myxococcota bacterium]
MKRWRPAFRIALALFAAGLVVGTLADRHPARPVLMRGGWRVLAADFHAHSRFSDGFLTPPELVLHAERVGLDVLAVTEHNLLFPAAIARWWSQLAGGPTVILGEEVTTHDWHLHALGIHDRVSPMQPLGDVIDAIHAQGGLAIAAHPVRRFWPALVPVIERLDGAELMHPLAYRSTPRGSGWSGADLVDFFAEAARRGHRLTAIASSDYHFGAALGEPRTLVFASSDSAEDVVAALRAGRTVVTMADGSLRGDPDALAAIAKDPLPMAERPDADGRTPLDVLGRILALAGLVGLVAFARR